jgi:hypothetical protein
MTELETSDSGNERVCQKPRVFVEEEEVNIYVLHKIINISIDWRQNAEIRGLYIAWHKCLEKDLDVEGETQLQTSDILCWFRRI